ncbi:MAG TPA: hypothetical protein VHO70_09340 [Chitinispirillaceae bacterium]|nr:hypothetical protein [Chitinispirillaceae bacterium]
MISSSLVIPHPEAFDVVGRGLLQCTYLYSSGYSYNERFCARYPATSLVALFCSNVSCSTDKSSIRDIAVN